jgi:hypothetical protein
MSMSKVTGKCRTKGCKVNRNAKAMHELFRSLLKAFQIGKEEVGIIKVRLEELMACFSSHKWRMQNLKKLADRNKEKTECYRRIGAYFDTSPKIKRGCLKTRFGTVFLFLSLPCFMS